jgi:hypothetical protein
MKNTSALFFVVCGLLSGVLCWLGGRILPEDSLLLKIYPGLVLGAVVFFAGARCGLVGSDWRSARLLVAVASTVAGWRLAVEVGYPYGEPVPYVAAGALGALITALGLLWSWSIRLRPAGFVLLITASGALGGMVFKIILDLFPNMNEDAWVLALFLEWQAIFMLGTWVAAKRSKGAAMPAQRQLGL